MGTYSYSGKAQFVTVQADGTYDITAYGARGGSLGGIGAVGGYGAAYGGNFSLTKGEKLEIIVGGVGRGSAGELTGGGGGGSFVLGNTGSGYKLLLAAGGGGGGGGYRIGIGGAGGFSGKGSGSGGAYGNAGTPDALAGGGGGSGVKSNGGGFGGTGGKNISGLYAGGAGAGGGTSGSPGGFGGGGGGAPRGGGGGGGYSGGVGGGNNGGAYYNGHPHRGTSFNAGAGFTGGYGGGGGTSYDAAGTPLVAHSASAENAKYYGNGLVEISPVCFVSGTRIRIARGQASEDVAVEALRVGDLVETASGKQRPIKWLGHRTVDCRNHPDKRAVWPIRIRTGAFGGGLPQRDLYLSPGHPVRVGEGAEAHLVPIMGLVNGTSIARVPIDAVEYWHVELTRHDILLAEGLPAESYLDWGDRPWFEEGADHALMNPDFVVPGLAGRCLPVALDGPLVEAERRRIDALFETSLAAQCAWPEADGDALGGWRG